MNSNYPLLALPWQAMHEAALREREQAGVEHFLLALCDVPTTPVADAFREFGITREVIEQRHPGLRGTAVALPVGQEKKEARLRGDGERLHGFAMGLAAAWGDTATSTHYLIAIAYEYPGAWFALGTTSANILDALQRHGARVPEAEPPLYEPYIPASSLVVGEVELQPLIDELRRLHAPGSLPRWAFHWTTDEPRRAAVSAEEGIDLDAALRRSRTQSD